MQKFRSALAAVTLFAVASLAHGGTLDAFEIYSYPSTTAPVWAPQSNVSYYEAGTSQLPANDTQVGFIVGNPTTGLLLKQIAGNALNRVTITFKAKIANPAEKFTFRQPEVYLVGRLKTDCEWDNIPDNEKTIKCSYRKTVQPFTFPSFIVFFDAPAQVGTFANDGISTTVSVEYAEDPVGGDRNNSSQSVVQTNLVTLGTNDPIDVRTAVSKGGGSIHTGDFGIPKDAANKRNTELVVVPTLPGLIAASSIKISTASGTSTVVGADPDCVNQGNFKDCPTFETQVVDALTGLPVVFTNPSQPLRTTYRIDASNLKRSLSQILGSYLISYSADGDNYQPITGLCVNGQPNTGDFAGTPCLLTPPKCFRNLNDAPNRNPELVGDCEWVLINRGNGFTRFQ